VVQCEKAAGLAVSIIGRYSSPVLARLLLTDGGSGRFSAVQPLGRFAVCTKRVSRALRISAQWAAPILAAKSNRDPQVAVR
jgi:hypothetical protein